MKKTCFLLLAIAMASLTTAQVKPITLPGKGHINVERLNGNIDMNMDISQLSVSPDNKRIYVATSTGACCLDLEKNSWTSFFGKNCLNYSTPTRIVREYSGRLWIGTNDGLIRYDGVDTEFFRTMEGETPGLYNSHIREYT